MGESPDGKVKREGGLEAGRGGQSMPGAGGCGEGPSLLVMVNLPNTSPSAVDGLTRITALFNCTVPSPAGLSAMASIA